MPEVNWDKATEGPDEKDHLPDCQKAMDENDSDCICAELEKDLGDYYADRQYDEYKDRQTGAI